LHLTVVSNSTSYVVPIGRRRFTEPSRALADFIVADATAAVRLEDPGAVRRLLAPVLAHPLLEVAGTPYCADSGRT
jgi:uridine kinase